MLTIKRPNNLLNAPRIEYSCDFAIVYSGKKRQQYIRYNETNGTYTWNEQKQSYKNLEERADNLKKSGCWKEVRDIYLEKKNTNDHPDKRSRALYAETINECYSRRFSKVHKEPNYKGKSSHLGRSSPVSF